MNDDLHIEPRLPLVLNPWQGVHLQFFADQTPEIDIEGARMSAKTTVCLDKEIDYLRRFPGIRSFLFRYSDTATRTKLKPVFEEMLRIRHFTDYRWDNDELAYQFTNGSKMYAFGLKAASSNARYEKLRGLDVSRVYSDQSEELPADIGQELRASLRQKNFPHQLTFSPNPVASTHWLADRRHGGFPEDNSIRGRRYYCLSIDDNAYNLPPESIESMKQTFPPDHAKHGAMILGKRGLNVIGNPVFEDTFKRARHVRPVEYDADALLLESFDLGKHSACYVAAQRLYAGGLAFLGGIIGEGLFLEDFLPIVKRFRQEWFSEAQPKTIRTCCTPPGGVLGSGGRYTSLSLLRRAGFSAIYRDNANSPDVLLALIERLASDMRRRGADDKESFAINSDESQWLKASREGVEPWPFMAQAFEAGAVWDEHWVSVGNQRVRQVKEDDWFSNALRCAQNIELNFCADQPTMDELDKRRQANRDRSGERGELARSVASWMGV